MRKIRSKPSPLPGLEWERRFGYPHSLVAGVDEVGRGCLAGPVVAGAVILPSDLQAEANPWIKDIKDSKLVSEESRNRLSPLIQNWVLAWALGVASVEEIDQLNIHYAAHLAMKRAVQSLNLKPETVIVDGKFPPKGLSCNVIAVVKGDQLCLSVACASILAKVWRDQKMVELDQTYAGYGFKTHKGYPTPAHQAALKAFGATKIHRRSFAPVAQVFYPKNF